MPGISNRRKKLKESVSKVQELKRAARNVTTAESNLNVVEPAKVDGRTKLKPGRKKAKKEEISCAVTRRIASVFKLEEKEKEKARERTINASEKLAELQKNVKKAAKKRRKINEKINMNIKIKKIEERTTELEEAIASANSDEPSTSSNDLLSNDTEDVMTFKTNSKRSEWPTIKSEDIVLRTIDTILADAEQVIHNNCQPRTHGSVFNYPLLRNIEITHFVPPPVHILISLVTVIIEWIRKIKSNNYTPLEEFLSKTGAKLHFPAKTYNGNECRKILSHFRQGNPKRILYDGYGKELFEAAANIELFSVARPLLNDEIQSLESFINLIFNLVKDYGQDALKFFLNKTKIHMLKEHVVPFVRMFGSWGIFSEQSVESIHHIRNVLDDRVPGAGPDIGLKRNNLFLKNQVVALRYC
uniref:Uncharacterized protein n=1 Tax=Panagrolaimus superbus TaxID=310955 RepID=A0A914Y0P1_9BILA